MTEREYIDATNLAKAQSAAQIVREYLNTGADYDIHAGQALEALTNLCDALVSRIIPARGDKETN